MRARTAAVPVLLAIAALTAGCSSGSDSFADAAACKKAMAAQYKEAAAKGDDAPEGTKPPACEGLDAKTLERIAGEVISDYLESDEFGQQVEDSVKDAMESGRAEPTDAVETPDLGDLEDDLKEIEEGLADLESELDATATP